jgi:TonB family protein
MPNLIFRLALPIAMCAATIPLTGQAPPAARDTVYNLDQVQVRPVPLNSPELAAALRTTYPPHLEEAGVGGAVVVEMVVGTDGQPRDMRLVSSTDTAFDAPTIAMVSLLRFSPAQVDGRAVGVRLELPINWEPGARLVDAPPPDSGDAYELTDVEVEPRLINRETVVRAMMREYPPHLRDAGVPGAAEVRFRVDEDGSVSHASVLSAHPQFGVPALRVVQLMRFKPATVGGASVKAWVVLPMQWQISRDGTGLPTIGSTDPLRRGCPVQALRC